MSKNPIPCGGFDYDANTLRFIERNGRPTLEVIGGVQVGEGDIDLTRYLRKDGDIMEGHLDMDGHNISDVHVLANQLSLFNDDKTAAIHLRMDNTNDELCVTTETGETDEALPLAQINVGEPTKDTHVVNRKYFRENLQFSVPFSSAGFATRDLNMGGYALTGVQKFSTNGSAPVFIGSTIEPEGTVGARITGLAGTGGIAVVKPDTIDEYEPITVADPTDADHAATKRYVDNRLPIEFAIAIEEYLNSVEGQAKIRAIIAAGG